MFTTYHHLTAPATTHPAPEIVATVHHTERDCPYPGTVTVTETRHDTVTGHCATITRIHAATETVDIVPSLLLDGGPSTGIH